MKNKKAKKYQLDKVEQLILELGGVVLNLEQEKNNVYNLRRVILENKDKKES